MQTLSDALLHNNNLPPPPPVGNRDVGRLVSGHRPPVFAGEEDPVLLEEWIRSLDNIFAVVGCPDDRRVELATFYFSHEADLWWVHEGPACQEEPGFDWSALKDKLRESFKGDPMSSLGREAKGVDLKVSRRPRQDFRARPAPPQSQGSTRVKSGGKGKPFRCRRCGKENIGKDCQGNLLQCFKCGRRGHKAYECHLQSDQGALPSSRVFVMSRSQAEAEDLVEEETTSILLEPTFYLEMYLFVWFSLLPFFE
ncbi:PREDICTED: uncharacterized protein LOC109187077 [Ipomoea nil]|uniref:uncharacterized protein LOC109187077 n=1 Tax=Ipomoea nil TaxID=35883 RepID=UPI000901663D|nr:PREDICTED: uncharacterized protein LOC109187077 [Ipomoea nil]